MAAGMGRMRRSHNNARIGRVMTTRGLREVFVFYHYSEKKEGYPSKGVKKTEPWAGDSDVLHDFDKCLAPAIAFRGRCAARLACANRAPAQEGRSLCTRRHSKAFGGSPSGLSKSLGVERGSLSGAGSFGGSGVSGEGSGRLWRIQRGGPSGARSCKWPGLY